MSGFNKAIALVVDAVGDAQTMSLYRFTDGESCELILKRDLPYSLGLMYTYYTAALGFKPNNDEYKLMGFCSYGKPVYKELILNQISYDQQNFDHILPDHMFKYKCIDLSSAFQNINNFSMALFLQVKILNADFNLLRIVLHPFKLYLKLLLKI